MKLMNRNGNMKLYSYERKVLMTYRFISSKFLQKTSEKRFFSKTVEQKQDEQKETKEEDKDNQEEPLPKFGPCPNFDDPNFNFKEELKRLSFELNLGEAPLNREQQVKFLNSSTTKKLCFPYMIVIWDIMMY